ncbi:protein trachealess-like isoform X1 [Biomphalaria glabrata]|uniref:Protein trachealess-like isoform X1 n=1 Tax=Biomphalaria glabrata TaxID=6526 RepID=A0A9W2ZZH6_BIOGL|nr:protein trachealess-like isoform X1 [Biomphalaria glabrata]
MNEHAAYFHWDLLRQPLQTPQFGMGAPFFDVNSILEIRKEKSRDAARSRRGKENYEFYELAKLLPLPAAITSQLDKASIIRLTISYLKLRDFSCHGDPQWTQEGGPLLGKLNKGHTSRLDIADPFESRQGTHILQSLDGFAFILASDGRFLYISETVSIYLGLSQVEMAGSSIFEYVHPKDHSELAEHLGMCIVSGPSNSSPGSGSEDGSSPSTPRPSSPSSKNYLMVNKNDHNVHKSFSLRMKSTLTKRGVQVKSSGYRVVHILGTSRLQSSYGSSRTESQNGTNSNSSSTNKSSSSEPPLLGLVGMAIALPPPTITELRLEQDTFITRLSPDFKIIYCEPIITDLMELSVEDVTDRLLYDLCHVADLRSLKRSHEDILNKGQALTDYYRIMNRHGGYVWVQTCATTLLNNKNAEDQTILAINYVVSGVENKGAAYDLWQLTGDVTSSMSSSSNSRVREDKLKELKSCKPSTLGINRIGATISSPSQSPNSFQKLAKNDDISAIEKISHTDRSPKSQLDSPATDADTLSPGKMSSSGIMSDNKNKRRKNENPRKRRRTNSGSTEIVEKNSNITVDDIERNSSAGETNVFDQKGPTAPLFSLHPDHVTSSSPEDLSMKKVASIPLDRRVIQFSSSSVTQDRKSPVRKKKSGQQKLDKLSTSPISVSGSSVQELEAAMNRHLPVTSTSGLDSSISVESHSYPSSMNASANMGRTFSTGPLTNTTPNNTHWLGSHSKPSGATDVLTASNFLRSLYANRESVIKTSSRTQVPYLNSEPPTSLLTPPEPDPATYKDQNNPYMYSKSDSLNHSQIYDKESGFESRDHYFREQAQKDQFSFIPYKDHISSSYIDHISSSMYKDHITSPYKDLSAYREIIPSFSIPSLMSPSGRMHQTYPSLPHHFSVPITSAAMDACSMTPPSSNSPEVNKLQPHPPYDITGYSSDLSGACTLSQKQAVSHGLPPLPPPSPGHINHSYHHAPHLNKDQLFQNGGDHLTRGGYYGPTGHSSGSMYMDLNQSSAANGQYEACSRSIIPWY